MPVSISELIKADPAELFDARNLESGNALLMDDRVEIAECVDDRCFGRVSPPDGGVLITGLRWATEKGRTRLTGFCTCGDETGRCAHGAALYLAWQEHVLHPSNPNDEWARWARRVDGTPKTAAPSESTLRFLIMQYEGDLGCARSPHERSRAEN